MGGSWWRGFVWCCAVLCGAVGGADMCGATSHLLPNIPMQWAPLKIGMLKTKENIYETNLIINVINCNIPPVSEHSDAGSEQSNIEQFKH